MSQPDRRLVRSLIILTLLAGGLVPHAAGHGEDGQLTAEELEHDKHPTSGYTGPSKVPYLSYFEGTWIYGQVQTRNLREQLPQSLAGDGDWLVWVDARRSDIYLHSISAGDGFYLTNDRYVQRNPAISGNIVVWEDYREGGAEIFAYDIDTGVTRKLSDGAGNHQKPSVHGRLVAWQTDRDNMHDIVAVDLKNGTPRLVTQTRDRESDVLVLDGNIYYRTFRFNVWDIHGHEFATNRTWPITSDYVMNMQPFTNGKEVLFLTQDLAGWRLHRYEAAKDRDLVTGLRFSDTTPTPASGEHVLYLSRDLSKTQLVVRNMTSGSTNHITGSLQLASNPVLMDKTVHVFVATLNGTQLLNIRVSDFAFAKRPSLVITSPGPSATWVRPITIRGILEAGTTFTEPETFTYRINGGPPQVLAPSPEWRVTLDPKAYEVGVHTVTFRATYLEGPPLQTSVALSVPQVTSGLDITANAGKFHEARLYAAYARYLGDNPAAWIVLPLLLIVLILIIARLVIAYLSNREDMRVEFVRPR